MSTSRISMPSLASWFFSRRQKPHHRVVYIVSGSGTAASFQITSVTSLPTQNEPAGFPKAYSKLPCRRL
jgi:hypothetical protein